jgi:hypothetical protein
MPPPKSESTLPHIPDGRYPFIIRAPRTPFPFAIMKLSASFSALAIASLASCATVEDWVPGGGDVRQSAMVDLGLRVFDHASANCIDEQPAFGLEYTVHREDGVFGYEFGLHNHNDRQDITATGRTRVDGWELTAGLRREFPIEGYDITPYIGLGIDAYTVNRGLRRGPRLGLRRLRSGRGNHARIGLGLHRHRRALHRGGLDQGWSLRPRRGRGLLRLGIQPLGLRRV